MGPQHPVTYATAPPPGPVTYMAVSPQPVTYMTIPPGTAATGPVVPVGIGGIVTYAVMQPEPYPNPRSSPPIANDRRPLPGK
jgi:hypothetical protein